MGLSHVSRHMINECERLDGTKSAMNDREANSEDKRRANLPAAVDLCGPCWKEELRRCPRADTCWMMGAASWRCCAHWGRVILSAESFPMMSI